MHSQTPTKSTDVYFLTIMCSVVKCNNNNKRSVCEHGLQWISMLPFSMPCIYHYLLMLLLLLLCSVVVVVVIICCYYYCCC